MLNRTPCFSVNWWPFSRIKKYIYVTLQMKWSNLKTKETFDLVFDITVNIFMYEHLLFLVLFQACRSFLIEVYAKTTECAQTFVL